ncbi:Aldehyde/histidinol dehydrogenase [Aspergillus spectabilis]
MPDFVDSRDSIKDIWGARTPYKHQWPTWCDSRLVDTPENGFRVPTSYAAAVMNQETFGPVIPIIRVSSDEEAVKWMNESDYGLTASIWTKDLEAGEKLMRQLEAGTVFINRCDYPNPDLAWTGWKNSGMGFTLGPRAFDPFFKLKSYHIRENQG